MDRIMTLREYLDGKDQPQMLNADGTYSFIDPQDVFLIDKKTLADMRWDITKAKLDNVHFRAVTGDLRRDINYLERQLEVTREAKSTPACTTSSGADSVGACRR
jgi:hypothetical protein